MSAAAELRAAASKLRELAQRATPGYFAAMHPLVGAALAGLLDEVAGHAESNDEYDGFPPESVITGYTPAVTIARLINGNAS